LIRPGDRVHLDNSWFLALQYYPRYQVPGPDQYGWNQYRNAQGVPIYPQRSSLLGPFFAQVSGGAVANGHFHGKMVMLASVMDVQAFPWSADWYHKQAQAVFGSQLGDLYRLWYMDNADHDPLGPDATTAAHAAAHIVTYLGEMQQALLDLDAWVAHGTPPPASTTYSVDANTQVRVPSTAAQRKGVQPVVTLSASTCAADDHGGGPNRPTANGDPQRHSCESPDRPTSDRVDVAVGQPVRFSRDARVPDDTGKIVRVEWDFLGLGDYPVRAHIQDIEPALHLNATYTFSKPGTYFPVVRVTSHRQGDPDAPYALIQNLGRVRVVVH
jgi:hypothetical protein